MGVFNNLKKQVGNTDINSCHIGDDKFDIENYIHGLRDFIMHCNTPMTIAIQGDWGTGKTSIMEMVIDDIAMTPAEERAGNITCIKFNTWEYSQFNLAAQLPMVMIDALVNQIKKEVETSGNDDAKKKLKEYSEKISDFVSVFATASLSMVTKGMVQLDAGNIKSLLPTGSRSGISELKENFSKAVSSIAPGEKDKLVVFIDDLDRLDPALAVEILEVLKIFLESPRCVFVLAIDYSVVQRGVKAKYGSDFDEQKGKNFFDKIIQVPFQVPVGNYNLKKYVGKCIEDSNLSLELKNEASTFINLIEASVGKNPRAIKRIFNALLLLQMVSMNTEESKNMFEDNQKVILLFAMLCLQQTCPNVYDYFAMNKESLDTDGITAFTEKSQDEISNEFDIDFDNDEFDKMKKFMPKLQDAIKANGKNGKLENGLPALLEVLALSAITNGNADVSKDRKKTKLQVDRATLKHERYTDAQVDHILGIVDSVINENKNVDVKYTNTKGYGHVEYRIGRVKFIDVIFYDDNREWLEVGCIPLDVSLWDRPDLSAICEKRDIMKGISYFSSRGISYKYRYSVNDDLQDDDLKTVVQACFDEVISKVR